MGWTVRTSKPGRGRKFSLLQDDYIGSGIQTVFYSICAEVLSRE
jgi:hypothetical protein